jgi:uncharacterized protein YacL
MLLKRTVQFVIALFGAMLGYQLHGLIGSPMFELGPAWMAGERAGAYFYMIIGALAGALTAAFAADTVIQRIHRTIEQWTNIPAADLISGIGGMVLGLLISTLMYPVFNLFEGAGKIIPVVLTLALGYIGFQVGRHKKEELTGFLSVLRTDQRADESVKAVEEHKILDTSVIIDGRIADICKTGFIEGTLVIPEFVLEELQHIADSSDLLKRNRGRRGLDILNRIQKELDVKVLIYEGDFDDIAEVDSKLVRLAKALQGKVVTNDFNLNKVCELQGVSVLNINDLANAVKPVVLPGEEILVQVIKDGKEHGQGVAYLDDGTMIVVEGGRDYIGTTMEVLVTSVLQTSAGRMIFAKPKLLEKAL